MAKPLSPKSKAIREAIAARPELGNAELAAAVSSPRMKVTPADVAQQRQAMKAINGRKAASPVELVDGVFDLAERCGGVAQLKRLVDRLAVN